jgi:hypothetical protein
LNFQHPIHLTFIFLMDLSPYQRLELFWQSKGLKNASAFADTVPGLTAAALSAMKKRGNLPSSPVMRSIQAAYPDINPDYILGDTGDMLKDNRSLTPANQLPPPVPSEMQPSRPGLPIPGKASPQEADFVGKYIARLEKELAAAYADKEYLQGLVTELLGKSDDSSDAAASMRALLNPPRARMVNMAPTPTRLAREAEQAAAATSCVHIFVAQWGQPVAEVGKAA